MVPPPNPPQQDPDWVLTVALSSVRLPLWTLTLFMPSPVVEMVGRPQGESPLVGVFQSQQLKLYGRDRKYE